MEILAEVDRNIDNGKPFAGALPCWPFGGRDGTPQLDIDCVDAGIGQISRGITNGGRASPF